MPRIDLSLPEKAELGFALAARRDELMGRRRFQKEAFALRNLFAVADALREAGLIGTDPMACICTFTGPELGRDCPVHPC